MRLVQPELPMRTSCSTLCSPARSPLPAAEVAEPFVDADDIAEVAVAALTEDGHAGELYELTGPRLLTFSDAVGEIAAATGRPIQYIQVSLEEYAAGATEHGVPADVVAA